jgi:DNA-binding transcriptional LysR family regulator
MEMHISYPTYAKKEYNTPGKNTMDMNLHSLRSFLAVARNRGVSRAVKDLHLTQPAISRQILALEETLGTPLFIRKGRFLTLTEAGQILQQYAVRILQLLSEARAEIDGLKGLVRGHLRISAASTIGIYMIPDVLGEFKAQYPGIDIALDISNKEKVLRSLQEGTADIGFFGPPVPESELAMETYLEDDLVLIVSTHHWLADRDSVSAKVLAEDVFILREKGSGTREIMEEELKKAGVSLRQAMELGSTEAIKKAVAANLGISIVSSSAVTLEVMLGHLCAVRVSDLNLHRPIYMLYARNSPLSPAAEGFRRFLAARPGSAP